jgi:hypothetical protein
MSCWTGGQRGRRPSTDEPPRRRARLPGRGDVLHEVGGEEPLDSVRVVLVGDHLYQASERACLTTPLTGLGGCSRPQMWSRIASSATCSLVSLPPDAALSSGVVPRMESTAPQGMKVTRFSSPSSISLQTSMPS